jgi:hypothetical protein
MMVGPSLPRTVLQRKQNQGKQHVLQPESEKNIAQLSQLSEETTYLEINH